LPQPELLSTNDDDIFRGSSDLAESHGETHTRNTLRGRVSLFATRRVPLGHTLAGFASALVLLAGGLATPAPAASAKVPKTTAVAIVRTILKKHEAACRITRLLWITARPASGDRWRVSARIRQAGYLSTVTWTLVSRRAVPNDQLAAEIQHGCP
jgi:hypothetical protein